MTKILQFIVLIYQKTLSPFFGGQCRFTPTCSCYMHDALGIHGPAKGLTLGLIRILKCNPWIRASWVDPVPEKSAHAFAWCRLLGYKSRNQK